ncbi:GNAT family N-acetyltransferase [Rhodocista pekingensis]|uniref:GNAT family N-acetyltransferase n=1 Tax=Rhodocista pekingensis TaxID=201185 RepID=A0ABW2KQR9_9PROT
MNRSAETLPRLRIEPLGPEHVTAGFDAGMPLVNAYLADALALQAVHLGRAFVAVESGDARVRGFYTLHGHRIDGWRTGAAAKLRPDAAAGAIRIAGFGVDRRYRGRGIGTLLFADALRRAKRVSSEVGIQAVVLDATDERAEAFYRGYGFSPVGPPDEAPPGRLWLRIADVP